MKIFQLNSRDKSAMDCSRLQTSATLASKSSS